ncbi:protein YgfX [Sapientia aquatica]|uniref:protein YgfX n=1 Tax=Sapientia aquatica TaxID=1549640 RepID=UPI003872F192
MSIALSVFVHPSKILRSCAIFFSFCLLFISGYLCTQTQLLLSVQVFAVVICALASFLSFRQYLQYSVRSWHLLVLGQGQLRCCSIDGYAGNQVSHKCHDNNVYKLLSGTTLWPKILFLRLQSLECDENVNLVILSDALSNDDFRRLSIACRWIVKHAQTEPL